MMSEKANVLQVCVSRAQSLAGLVEYSDDSIVSKTVLDKPAGTITLLNMRCLMMRLFRSSMGRRA